MKQEDPIRSGNPAGRIVPMRSESCEKRLPASRSPRPWLLLRFDLTFIINESNSLNP